MKNLSLFFTLLFPLFLFGQNDSEKHYQRVLKTNISSPWFGLQSTTLSFEKYLPRMRSIEVEAFYNFSVLYPKKEITLSHTLVNLQNGKFSGGMNVFQKKHFSEKDPFYISYGGGYQFIAYENTHTVCTEVGDALTGICPCLAFEENTYQRNVNRLSIEGRIGIETPINRHFKRLRFDFFLGIPLQYLIINEQDKLSHVLCSVNLENEREQELVPMGFDFLTFWTANKTSKLNIAVSAGVKIGYAF